VRTAPTRSTELVAALATALALLTLATSATHAHSATEAEAATAIHTGELCAVCTAGTDASASGIAPAVLVRHTLAQVHDPAPHAPHARDEGTPAAPRAPPATDR